MRGLSRRIDELNTARTADQASNLALDERLRVVELKLASSDAARISAERAHSRWRTAIAALVGASTGISGAFATRWLDH